MNLNRVFAPLSLLFLVVVICLHQTRQTDAPAPPFQPVLTPTTEVVAYTASWCGFCQQAKPDLARIESAGIKVTYVDIDKQVTDVASVPTFVVRVRGKEYKTQSIRSVLALLGMPVQRLSSWDK
jgi:thiol-disulfide isomerase/thioredoxin